VPNLKLALTSLFAALFTTLTATPAFAATNWVGTANYGVETVGPFNTYDFSSAGVLLLDPQTPTLANGYYQSFVTQHLLDGLVVSNPLLSAGNYEITVVADFVSQTTFSPFGQTFATLSGNFSLWLDTTPDRNFNTDTGFNNEIKIMEGVILSGAGSLINISAQQFGGGALQLQVTGFDTGIFEPDTISAGESIFTLRLNSPVDTAFLSPITSVQSHAYAPLTGDLLYAADGSLILTAAPVPEPSTYALALAGFGVIGGAVIRRRRSAR
jgi:hypothetical protein